MRKLVFLLYLLGLMGSISLAQEQTPSRILEAEYRSINVKLLLHNT